MAFAIASGNKVCARRAEPEPDKDVAAATAAADATAVRACFFSGSLCSPADAAMEASASNWSSMCTVLAPEELSAAGEAGVPNGGPPCEDGGAPMVKASLEVSEDPPRLASPLALPDSAELATMFIS